ncbi:hypothetical protein B5X24_HaOG211296 [Helicoverpa armigera]|uniref:Tudor domain-containing protein 1 n=1 Tax=Helicoverpa armigera TaxID=29058 RepID=A0A2W1BEY2_HELAM|nr:hypothetical protein B5X24_HaOG211296 [Helicoverpa armigera]
MMTSRGRNYTQSNEWDSTREDYNSSIFDAQYGDEDTSGEASQLDHCRLYIKNIPKGLNEEGLRSAFAKFGTLTQVFLSRDPQKSYGLVKYETPGEAKLAMMKMNRTEPLRLQINIAYKSKATPAVESRPSRNWQDRNTNASRDRSDRASLSNRDREESGSVASRSRTSRVQEDIPNGENNMDELLMEDDYGFSDILDPNLHLELESLKLEQLKVREEQLQCKQRVILLKQAERRPMAQMSNRCILPDGKIVVRNVNDRDSRDADVSFSAGAGDSLTLPGLQREAARQCVVCGLRADKFCAGCGITPYCAEACQRRDWLDRHKGVCHNLARLNVANGRAARDIPDTEPKLQPAPPLRRPNLQNDNKREQEDNNNTYTSKASVKSSGSGNRDDKPKFQGRQPAKPRQFNQERDNEPAKPTQQPSPTKEAEARTKPRSFFNKVPQKVTRQPARETEVTEDSTQKNIPTPVVAKPTMVPTSVVLNARQNLVPKTSAPEQPQAKPEAVKPEETAPPPKETPPVVKLASVSDVTPTKKYTPKNYLMEKLAIGNTVVISVESKASDCRTNRGDFVCVTMSEAFQNDYEILIGEFGEACEEDQVDYKPNPGETCSYFDPSDSGWYRARCLNPTTLALLDGAKIVTVSAADKIRKLPSKYEAVPEFCAVLCCKTVQVGANVSCEILSNVGDGFKVSMKDVESDQSYGDGELYRWLPTVEHQAPTPAAPAVVERPPITDGTKVFLVLADHLDKAYVCASDADTQRRYNEVLQNVLLKALNAKPLKEPPQVGQTVIGKYSDGMFYRALVLRTKVKENRYLIEYIEYGNTEVSNLENLYPCPLELSVQREPSLVSAVKLADRAELSAAARALLDQLKNHEELLLTLPNGRKSAPSGSEATLTIIKNKDNLNSKLLQMCTPEWKKMQDRGGDVVETQPLMYQDMQHTSLPEAGCTVQVLDISMLTGGVVSGHAMDDPHADDVFNRLTQKMAEYCNSPLGKEPYLPKPEEVCIAQMPPYDQWFRAVFLDLEGGPGSKMASLCYLDYGNLASVPVSLVRKMLPEFITGYPVMGLNMEIRNFPKDPSTDMISRAIAHMNIDDEGKGTLKLINCEKTPDGMYLVDAPELLKAMKG